MTASQIASGKGVKIQSRLIGFDSLFLSLSPALRMLLCLLVLSWGFKNCMPFVTLVHCRSFSNISPLVLNFKCQHLAFVKIISIFKVYACVCVCVYTHLWDRSVCNKMHVLVHWSVDQSWARCSALDHLVFIYLWDNQFLFFIVLWA